MVVVEVLVEEVVEVELVDVVLVEEVVEVELVDVVDELEVEVVEVSDDEGSSAGRVNGGHDSPRVTTDMYLFQIVAGNEPPVTDIPCTERMNVPSG